jgi:energy-coupling factor transporter ATP-binding protein EcfA2
LAVELVAASIETYEYLQQVELPLGSLTLLFGRNGGGKSTILEALVQGLNEHQAKDTIEVGVRLHPPVDTRSLADILSCSLTRVRRSYEDALRTLGSMASDSPPSESVGSGRQADDAPSEDAKRALQTHIDRLGEFCPSDESWEAMTSALAARLGGNYRDDPGVQRLLSHALESPTFLFQHRALDISPALNEVLGLYHKGQGFLSASLAIDRRQLTDSLWQDWLEVAGDPAFDGTPVGDAARRLTTADSQVVPVFEIGPAPAEHWTPPVPVVVLDSDTTGLVDHVIASIGKIFGRLVGITTPYNDEVLLFDRHDRSDPWLEPVDPDDEDAGLQLRTGLRTVAEAIEAEANRIAPAFVTEDDAVIRVGVREPQRWAMDGRLELTYERHGRRLGFDHAGEGLRRWLGVTVREACRGLEQLERTGVELADGSWVTQDIDHALFYWRQMPPPLDKIEFEIPSSPGLLLADEPELHLHPLAVSDVRRWLEQRTQAGLQVVAATHSPRLLNVRSQLAEHLFVTASADGCKAAPVGPELLDFLAQSAAEAGMEAGDALQVTRLLVIVEGKHDAEIIRHFFTDQLRSARALLLRLEGTANSQALVYSEYLAHHRVPMRVMFDNTGASPLKGGLAIASGEERKSARLLELARSEGVDLRMVSFAPPDIICALPEAAVRRAFPEARFEGWGPLIGRWRSLNVPRFKQWALEQMGLARVRPTTFVREVLEVCETVERPSRELERAVRELLADPDD